MVVSPTLTNGKLFVTLSPCGYVQDIFFSHQTLTNYAPGISTVHRLGVWVDGKISWLADKTWDIQQTSSQASLVCHTVATNRTLGLTLEISSAVDSKYNVFLREISVRNDSIDTRNIKLFLHQAFIISDAHYVSDTAQYVPDIKALLHYSGNTTFMISARSASTNPSSYTVGLFGSSQHKGSWYDAEDGNLAYRASEYGQVDSTLEFSLVLAAHTTTSVEYWCTAGSSLTEVRQTHAYIRTQGVATRYTATRAHWRRWLRPVIVKTEAWQSRHQPEMIQSVLALGSRLSQEGVLFDDLSSSQRVAVAHPYYTAAALLPLIELGYTKEPLAFFKTCRQALQPGGYLPATIQSTGAPGPMSLVRSPDMPYSSDYLVGAATVLQAFYQYHRKHKRTSPIADFYDTLIVPLATTLSAGVQVVCQAPQDQEATDASQLCTTPSILGSTAAIVHEALQMATQLAEYSKDADHAVEWRIAAEDIILPAASTAVKEDDNPIDTLSLIQVVRSYIHAGRLAEADAILNRATQYLYRYGILADTLDKPGPLNIIAQAEYTLTLIQLEKARRKR